MSRTGRSAKSAPGAVPSQKKERRRRYWSGHFAEMIASAYLMVRGYRVLGRRYRTAAGEIDLICMRRGRIGFVEVKRRSSLQAAQDSITARQRERVRKAAQIWLGAHPRYQACDIGFDLVFLVPGRLPVHLRDAL